MSHDTIVSHNHSSEVPCLPIDEEQLTYADRNYLAREVANPSEVEKARGGEIIPLLDKPGYACPATYVTRADPVFKQRAKAASPTRMQGANAVDSVTLPDVSRSVKNRTILGTTPSRNELSPQRTAYASLFAKAVE